MKRISLLILLAFVFGCDDKNEFLPPAPEIGTGKIYGNLKFIDGTPGSNAMIRLKDFQTNVSLFTGADENGNYEFNELVDGKYQVVYQSPAYEMNVYLSDTLETVNNSELKHDFTITYRMLDDQKLKIVNDDMFLIQYHHDAGRIGDSLHLVKGLIGFYSNDFTGRAVLSSKVYSVPDSFDWEADSGNLDSTYITNNLEFLFELQDWSENSNHLVYIDGEKLGKLLTSVNKGFLFVKVGTEDQVLKVPCIDRQNNDFGLLFDYNF